MNLKILLKNIFEKNQLDHQSIIAGRWCSSAFWFWKITFLFCYLPNYRKLISRNYKLLFCAIFYLWVVRFSNISNITISNLNFSSELEIGLRTHDHWWFFESIDDTEGFKTQRPIWIFYKRSIYALSFNMDTSR